MPEDTPTRRLALAILRARHGLVQEGSDDYRILGKLAWEFDHPTSPWTEPVADEIMRKMTK